MPEILLVDDEIPVRLALRTLGNWTSVGVQTIHEASNGHEALQTLEAHPEVAVLITDIKMPVMDGIELISHARRLRPDLTILVLSGFEEYDLIREAFRRGADDYILKPRLEPDAVVSQVGDYLAHRAPPSAGSVRGDPDGATRQWLRALADASDLESQPPAPPEDFRLAISHLSVMSLWVDDFSQVKGRYLEQQLTEFQIRMDEVLGRFLSGRTGAVHVAISPQEYLLFLPWSTSTWIIEAKHSTQELCHLFRHFLDIRVSIGVSEPVDQLKQLTLALREARTLVQLRHILGRGRVIFARDSRDLKLSGEGLPTVDTTLFLSQVTAGDFSRARESWKAMIDVLAEYRLASLSPYRTVAHHLVRQLLDLLSASGVDAVDVLGADRDPSVELAALESVEDLKIWLAALGGRFLDVLESHRQLITSHHIVRARRYLDSHFNDPELSLEEVARQVGLSRTYFSSLFEKEVGTGYSEYLNSLRIRNAQRLLKTTNLKIYEISERCGFNSVEYFSRLFRKATETTPAQFRDG